MQCWLVLVRLLLPVGDRLFDQHHRDAVHDRVANLAVRAAQDVGLAELNPRVAPGAREDLEQLLRNHSQMLLR